MREGIFKVENLQKNQQFNPCLVFVGDAPLLVYNDPQVVFASQSPSRQRSKYDVAPCKEMVVSLRSENVHAAPRKTNILLGTTR